MELDGTRLVVLKAPKNTLEKQQFLFTEIMTQLFKIFHRRCCEQFHVGTIFFVLNYTCQPYNQAEKRASTHG